MTAPDGYVTLAEAARILGIPVGGTNGGLNLYIHQVDIETGQRRLPAEWINARKTPDGGFYAIRLEDLHSFAAQPRKRGGGQRGARGNVRRWDYQPLR